MNVSSVPRIDLKEGITNNATPDMKQSPQFQGTHFPFSGKASIETNKQGPASFSLNPDRFCKFLGRTWRQQMLMENETCSTSKSRLRQGESFKSILEIKQE